MRLASSTLMMSALPSLLRALIRRSASAQLARAPVATPADGAVSAELAAPDVPVAPPADRAPQTGLDDGAAAEDEWGGEDEEPGADASDPFITGAWEAAEPLVTNLQAARAYARAQALGAEHRILLSTPAGPGSLAEALNRLLEEGLVQADFFEDGEDGPYMLYRPLEDPPIDDPS